MLTWSTPKTDFAAGEVLTYTHLNNIGTDLTMLAGSDSYEFARASGTDNTTSTSYADISGLSLSLARSGKWLVQLCVWGYASGGSNYCTISVAGSDDSNAAYTTSSSYVPIINFYEVTVSGSATVKGRYKAGAGTAYYGQDGTFIYARWVGP